MSHTICTFNVNNLYTRYKFGKTFPGDLAKKSGVAAVCRSIVKRLRFGSLPGVLRGALNQATEDWHTNAVTLSATKGLGMRFFPPLRMTRPSGRRAKCTNVMWFDLVARTIP